LIGCQRRTGIVFDGAIYTGAFTARGRPDLFCEAPQRAMGAMVRLMGYGDKLVIFTERPIGGLGGVAAMYGWLFAQAVLYFAPAPNCVVQALWFISQLEIHASRPYRLDSVIETVDELDDLAWGSRRADELRDQEEATGAHSWAKPGSAAAPVENTTQTPNHERAPAPAAGKVPIPVPPS
jgi:hypothetical protein